MKRTFLHNLRWMFRIDISEESDDPDPEKKLVEDTVLVLNRWLNKGKKNFKDKNNEFVRKLRDSAFKSLQRKCETRIWEKLIEHAKASLNRREEEEGRPAKNDWKHAVIGSELCGVDPGTISNALSGKVAPITLPRLLAALVHLEKHWGALGDFAPFDDLRTELLLHAIGFAQTCVGICFPKLAPPAERPTPEELSLLKAGIPDDTATPERVVTWKTWGMGWLITKHKLGLKRGLTDEPKQSRNSVLPHGQRQPGGHAKVR